MALKLLFEGLIEHGPHLGFEPRLARELPEISEDGRVYTFRLRPGVRFHNGRELVADDVRWSMEHMLHPETASPGAPFFELIEGVADFQAGRAEHIAGIRVLDRWTVQFRLRNADATFLHVMSMGFAYPVARENYETPGADRRPIGTGAFVFESWEPGLRLTFSRNPDFFRPGEPYLDRLVFELNLTRGPAFMRFQAAELDHIHRFTPTDYLWFRRQEAWREHSEFRASVDIWGLEMNTELAPFDNRHVRRAVAFAVHRERWNRQRAGRLAITGQPIPATLPAFDPDLPGAHVYDLERAREEMALAGHPVTCRPNDAGVEVCVAEGLDAEFDLWIGDGATGRDYGALAQQDLAAIGLRARLRPVSFPVYLRESGTPRTVQMLFGGWQMDFPDPASFLDPLFHSRSARESDSSNRAFYRNPEVDRLIDAAHGETSEARRTTLYREASRIIVDDAPWAFLFSNMKLEAWQPYVHYRPHPVSENMYRDVWLDLPRRRIAQQFGRTRTFAALAPLGRWH
jgi:peptide/nickel transport system substrate-binding protein